MISSSGHFKQRDVQLASGQCLPELTLAYRSLGQLNAHCSNAILLLHGYTGGPDMLSPDCSVADGSWAALVGPGKTIDTDHYCVICPNLIGSCQGSTHAASLHPVDGLPWGSRFPDIAMSDQVVAQRALLDHLGIGQLAAVIGNSFGGALAFQWGVDRPADMRALVIVHAAPAMPGVDVEKLRTELAAMPGWNGGDYYGQADFQQALSLRRMAGLRAFGADAALKNEVPDAQQRQAHMERLASQWARHFDANALLNLFKTMAGFDVRPKLTQLRAPVLFGLCSSDLLLPARLAPAILESLQQAQVPVQYIELQSEHGHCAAGSDPDCWSGVLQAFLQKHAHSAQPG